MARWVRAGWGRGEDCPGTQERGQRGGARGRRGFGRGGGTRVTGRVGRMLPDPRTVRRAACGLQRGKRGGPCSARERAPRPGSAGTLQPPLLRRLEGSAAARPHPSARLPLQLSPLPVLTPGGCSDARSHRLATEDASLHFFNGGLSAGRLGFPDSPLFLLRLPRKVLFPPPHPHPTGADPAPRLGRLNPPRKRRRCLQTTASGRRLGSLGYAPHSPTSSGAPVAMLLLFSPTLIDRRCQRLFSDSPPASNHEP